MIEGFVIGIILSVIIVLLCVFYLSPIFLVHNYAKYILRDKTLKKQGTAIYVYTYNMGENCMYLNTKLNHSDAHEYIRHITDTAATVAKDFIQNQKGKK